MTAPARPTPSATDSLSFTRPIRVGTAGWSIPRQHADLFPGEGAHLNRYSSVLNCSEINTTFYRSHRAATYARRADITPEGFQFSVKAPRAITHECGLAPSSAALATFLDEVLCLGHKLGPILFQLPPSQSFHHSCARAFLATFRKLYPRGPAAVEPRHPTWFSEQADQLMCEFEMARVAADPAVVAAAKEPGGHPDLRYFRLHGSPRMYYSDYSADAIDHIAEALSASQLRSEVWCIFDNTASGAAAENAVTLLRTVADR